VATSSNTTKQTNYQAAKIYLGVRRAIQQMGHSSHMDSLWISYSFQLEICPVFTKFNFSKFGKSVAANFILVKMAWLSMKYMQSPL
jgi:hypothetical protein